MDRDASRGDNPGVNESLLVVEDDPSLREVIGIGLEGEGFRVTLAEDGPSALLAFASQTPDLVLLDVMLPGLDGFSVCRELRKVSLVPIIMLTARASTGGRGPRPRVGSRRLRHQAVRLLGIGGPDPLGPPAGGGQTAPSAAVSRRRGAAGSRGRRCTCHSSPWVLSPSTPTPTPCAARPRRSH